MLAGRIVEIGPTPKILAHPLHPYTELLISAAKGQAQEGPSKKVPAGPEGCAFADRCRWCEKRCLLEPPPNLQMEDGDRAVRCFRFLGKEGKGSMPSDDLEDVRGKLESQS